jgi:hypothetical protein
MDIETLKAIMASVAHDKMERFVQTGGIDATWLPVIRAGESSAMMGITSQGEWVAQSTDGSLHHLFGRSAASGLPILEKSPQQFMSKLSNALAARSLPREIIETFPIKVVLICAMESESLYWQRLALNWAGILERDQALIHALSKLTERGLSQAVRHGARKHLRRLTSGVPPKSQ